MIMAGKTLKSEEVISTITKKIQLKKQLRIERKKGNQRKVDIIQMKIDQLEDHLSSSPLSKT